MKSIKCKKCGATVDISKGECPICGTMYYIVPENELNTGSSDSSDMESTRAWTMPQDGDSEPKFVEYDESLRQSTRAIPPIPPTGSTPQRRRPDMDETRVQNAQPRQPQARQPQQRQGNQPRTNQRPQQAQQQSRRGQPQRRPIDPRQAYYEEGYDPRDDERGDGIKRGLIVGAIALMAVLVVVVCIMSGVFDFGGDAETMPNVVGMQDTVAKALLEELGVKVTLEEVRGEETKGTVIEQSLREGKDIGKSTKVTLTVSDGEGEKDEDPENTGEPDVLIPQYVGMTLVNARKDAETRGLNIVQLSEEYSTKPAGEILSQSPTSGSYIENGGIINVTVSKGPEPTPTYTITVTAGKGGTVSPKGQTTVEEGKSATFTIKPDEGYELRELKIDGVDVGVMESYTFTDVKAGHTLYAVFQLKPEPTPSPTPDPTPSPTPVPTPDATLPSPDPQVQNADGGALTLP